MAQRFNEQLLQDFIHGHYGYGNYGGDYWFIGMEEGGGNSFEEISKRLEVWAELGRGEVEDVAEYHFRLGMPRLFSNPVLLQSTWNKLIRILLSTKGETPTTDQVRAYQRDRLGRTGGETCLLELFPLPSPGTNRWIYDQHSSLPYLKSREDYRSACKEWRIEHIRERISEYTPKAVIFYGLAYKEWWQEIAGMQLEEIGTSGFMIGRKNNTIFAVIRHPVATGITNSYFRQVGKTISTLLGPNRKEE